jgi:formylglycine-generating enzyme required for sulfatase activity
MKNVPKAILILGVISFWIGTISGCGEKHSSSKEIVPDVSQANEEKALAGEVQSDLEQEKTVDLGNGMTMEFVLIPAGSFNMGTPSSEKSWLNYDPISRLVRITRSFYMGKYEVTQGQWELIMGTTIQQQRDKCHAGMPLHGVGSEFPMYYVSWDDAVEFCKKLGSGFRLPTEAEWEYACRAGSDTHFCYGDDPNCFQISWRAWYQKISDSTANDAGQNKPNAFHYGKFTSGDEPNCYQLDQYAWHKDNSFCANPVGKKKPNVWGLYDMHGNIGEWCADWYSNNSYYMTSVDPTGPANGKHRVVRSGSWFSAPEQCRSAARIRHDPNLPSELLGFRIVLDSI